MSLFGSSAFSANQPTTNSNALSKPTFGTTGSIFGSNAATNAPSFGAIANTTSAPSSGFSLTSQPSNSSVVKPLSFGSGTPSTQPVLSFGSAINTKPITTSGVALSFGTGSVSSAAPSLTTGQNTNSLFGGPVTSQFQATTTKPSVVSSQSVLSNISTCASTNPSTANPALGTLNFGLKTVSSTAPSLPSVPSFNSGLNLATSKPVTTSLSTGFSLSSSLAPNTTTSTSGLNFSSAPKAVAVSTQSPGGLNFGLASKTTHSTTAPLSFGISATSTPTSVATTTSTSSAKQASALTYRQLEDMVNKWSMELEEQERHFMKETSKLNHWDRDLVQNADKINDLQSKMNDCETEQKRIEQELEFIESQQRELESILEPLESSTKDFPPSQQHVDAEREAIFQMAISADFELGQMLMDLQQLASKVNNATSTLSGDQNSNSRTLEHGLSSGTKSNSDLIPQLTKILNAHMHSLNWVHNNTQQLMEKTRLLDKQES